MGRKRQRHQDSKQAAKAAVAAGAKPLAKGQVFNSTSVGPPTRLLALHATAGAAVAFGKTLAVAVSGADSPADIGPSAQHDAIIRAVAFDPTGTWLLTADDSRTVRLWRTADWTVAHTFTTPKKPSCCGFDRDGVHALVGDKFGDVTVAATDSGAATLLLGHYCSTITSLVVSPNGQCLATTDRDNKVRVSLLPPDPLKGAHEIQSYCLGHEAFVTCAAFVQGDSGATALVTASGDGSVRLWNHFTGEQIAELQIVQQPEGNAAAVGAQTDVSAAESQAAAAESSKSAQKPAEQLSAADTDTQAVAAEAEQQEAVGPTEAEPAVAQQPGEEDGEEGNGGSEEPHQRGPAVTILAVSPNNCFVAAAVEGRDDITLLRVSVRVGRNCGRTKGTLSMAQPLDLPQVQLPTSLAFDAAGRLWVAGGPLHGEGGGELRLAVAQPESASADCQVLPGTADDNRAGERFVDVTDATVSPAMRAAAAACALSVEELQAAEVAATESGGQLGLHLKKKVYSKEEIEGRKRMRADVQLKSVAAADAGKKQAAATL